MSKKLSHFLKINNSLAVYGIAYAISNSLQKAIGFLIFLLFASIFSVPDYVVFGKQYAIFSVVSGLACAGITEAIITLLKQYNSNRGSVYQSGNFFFLLLAGISAAATLTVLTVVYYKDLSAVGEYLIVIVAALLSSFFMYQAGIVRYEEKHKFSIALSFLPAVAGYIFGLLMVIVYDRPVYFFLGSTFGYVLALALYSLPFASFNGFTKDKVVYKQIRKRVTPYILIALLSWVMGYGNTFMVDFLFSEIEVGKFVFLYTISSVLLLLGSSMNQVWSPRFCSLFGNTDSRSLEDKYIKYTTLQGTVLGLAGSLLILAVPFGALVYPKLAQYSFSQIEMFYLFLGYIVSIPWWHVQNYYIIENKGRMLFSLTAVSSIIGYIVWVLCMVTLGHHGIYIGFFLQLLIKSVIVYLPARKRWQVQFDTRGILAGTVCLLIGTLVSYKFFN
jgi:O-antigen/teichoic acid export membrane protein